MKIQLLVTVILLGALQKIVCSDFLREFQERQNARQERMAELEERAVVLSQRSRTAMQEIAVIIAQNRASERRRQRPTVAIQALIQQFKQIEKDNVPKDWKCTICLSNKTESSIRATNCKPVNHLFHENPCFEDLLKSGASVCPNCRQPIIGDNNPH